MWIGPMTAVAKTCEISCQSPVHPRAALVQEKNGSMAMTLVEEADYDHSESHDQSGTS
jgi:hypothetical protein